MQLKRHLINGYRLLTMPLRQLLLSRMKSRGRVPVGILFYHRVADTSWNPWTISNSRFVEQVDWLQKHFDLVSLDEARRRIESGHNDRPTVSITFDDGYADNCTQALPLLIERGIPVTYFVTSTPALKQIAFPHDLERQEPLAANNGEMLSSLSRAGVEIGGHTRTHPDLGAIDCEQQLQDEVIGGILALEQVIDQRIRYFAFPFGQQENLNRRVFQICRDHGIEAVCSAYGGWNEIGGDSYHLQRFHGDHRIAYLKNWLTFDPRKRHQPRYDAGLEPKEKSRSFPIPEATTNTCLPTAELSNFSTTPETRT